jgi:carbon starvation protein CstA
MSKGRNYLWAFIPFIFMFITTMAALLYTVVQSFAALTTGKIIADVLAVILFISALILAWDGIQAVMKFRAEMAKPAETGGGE